ncbi:MAG: hypothetical protein ACF8R9_12350 [Phycisphaerales bacterium JB054]
MAERANVGSVEALRAFKPAVVKFAEESQAAISASEISARRTLDWLLRERRPTLQREIRRYQEEIVRARTRMISRADPMQDNPLPKVDDRLELDAAKRRLRDAEEKLEHVRRWSRQLERALEEYHGAVSQLGWFVRGELGKAVGALEQMGNILESYAQLGDRRPTRPAAGDAEQGDTP